jgi:hypothetical protein
VRPQIAALVFAQGLPGGDDVRMGFDLAGMSGRGHRFVGIGIHHYQDPQLSKLPRAVGCCWCSGAGTASNPPHRG